MRENTEVDVTIYKQKVIQNYGVAPDYHNLPHDVNRWLELIHENLTLNHLNVAWLKEQIPGGDESGRRFSCS